MAALPEETPAPRKRGRPRKADIVRGITEADIKRLVDKYSAELEFQLQLQTSLDDRYVKWLEIYHGQPRTAEKNWPWDGASNIVVNLAGTMVDSVVAKIMGTIFAVEPHWVGRQLNSESAAYAQPVSRWMDWLRMNTWDQYAVVKSFVQEMCKLGTGVIYNGWQETNFRRYDPQMGRSVDAGRLVGPAPRWVPREDFLIPAGYATIDSAPWVAARSWYSYVDLQRLEADGRVREIANLKGHSDDENRLRQFRREREEIGGQVDTDDLGLYAPWHVWVREDLDGDGYPEGHVLLIHIESKTMLRYRPNPYIGEMRPFVKACLVEIENSFNGLGIPEMLEHYQEEASTIHNQRRDNATIANTPTFKNERGSGVTGKLKFKPGDWFTVNSIKGLEQLEVGTPVQSQIQEEAAVIGLAERRIGISDLNLGRESSPIGRAAATTVVALLQEGAGRFDLNTSEIRKALSEQGRQILELYQTHGMPGPSETGSPEMVLGQGEDAALVRNLLGRQETLRGVLGINLNVATAAVNREIEKQSNIQLFQIVGGYIQQVIQLAGLLQQPIAPPIKEAVVRGVETLDKIMQRIMQSHQVYDMDSILMADTLAQMAAAPAPMMGMMGAAGAQPGSGAAPPQAGGMPPELAAMMGQMMGGGGEPQ